MTEEERIRYEKELRFGELMLRKAKRRLLQMEHSLSTKHEWKYEFANLGLECLRLKGEIETFEQEVNELRASLQKRGWSAS